MSGIGDSDHGGEDNRRGGGHGGTTGDNFFRRGSRRGGSYPTNTDRAESGNSVATSSTNSVSGGYGGGISLRPGGGHGGVLTGKGVAKYGGESGKLGRGSSDNVSFSSGGSFRASGDYRQSEGSYGGSRADSSNRGWREGSYRGGGGSGGWGEGNYGGGGGSGGGVITLSKSDWESVRSTLMEEAVRKLSLSEKKPLEPPRRPGFGNLGLPCLVKANHFLVEIAGQGSFYRYNVINL